MKKQKNAPQILPREEWPYEVPENWVWTQLLSGGAECLDKYRQPVNATERKQREGNIPYYGATGQVGWIDAYLTDEQLVLLGEDGAPFLDVTKNKAYMIDGPAWVNNHAHILRSLYGDIGNQFLLHYLNQFDYTNYVSGTTRLKLTQAKIGEIPFPLPPLPEQQRIVARIESLFAKLDAAAEKIRAALDQFPTRKAAILHKAFTGDLTKKWREENGVGMESWENRSITSLCDSLQYGTSQKSQKTGKVIVLRMGNLQNGEIDWSNLAYTDNADDIKKYKLEKGDVLFNRTNSAELVGKTSIYRGDYPAIYAGYLIKLDYHKDEITGDYLNFVLNSERARAYCQSVKSDGVNQSNINAQKIGAFEIDLPPLPEQKEIVRILDAIFEREQAAKETAERLLEQIALTKKSILARAFRGLLGTNDPKEESAEGWLEGEEPTKRNIMEE